MNMAVWVSFLRHDDRTASKRLLLIRLTSSHSRGSIIFLSLHPNRVMRGRGLLRQYHHKLGCTRPQSRRLWHRPIAHPPPLLPPPPSLRSTPAPSRLLQLLRLRS